MLTTCLMRYCLKFYPMLRSGKKKSVKERWRDSAQSTGMHARSSPIIIAPTNSHSQWYDVAIHALYSAPYLSGGAYELFVRTICPSVLAHIKPTALSSLVKHLDLSHIVHNGNKSVTARLLGRTKSSLETFIAPQASFAINSWASLSKCVKLQVLDLTLVSEMISWQSLGQTIRQLGALRELYLPRCSTDYERGGGMAMSVRWPPQLQHLSLSGSVSGKFLWDMLRQVDSFPPSLGSLSVLHSPGLDHVGVKSLLCGLGASLTTVELRDLKSVKHGRFNGVLDWLPRLTRLTIALDYIDSRFGHMPADFSPHRWEEAKPLQRLVLVSSGETDIDPSRSFTAVDLYALIDERFLGRLRWLDVARSCEWHGVGDGAELEALEMLLVDDLDRENWTERRWHYEGVDRRGAATYEEWLETGIGRRMGARLRILKNV